MVNARFYIWCTLAVVFGLLFIDAALRSNHGAAIIFGLACSCEGVAAITNRFSHTCKSGEQPCNKTVWWLTKSQAFRLFWITDDLGKYDYKSEFHYGYDGIGRGCYSAQLVIGKLVLNYRLYRPKLGATLLAGKSGEGKT